MKSFRWRIIVWTTAIAGFVMLAFGIAGSLAYERLKRNNVDKILVRELGRPMPPPQHDRYWSRFGADIKSDIERELGASSVVFVYQGEVPSDFSETAQARVWGAWQLVFEGGGALPPSEGELLEQAPFPSMNQGVRGQGPRGSFRAGREGFAEDALGRPEISTTTYSSEVDGADWRLGLARFSGYNVGIAVALEPVMADVAQARLAFAIAFPAALGVLGLAIWGFATRAIAPVRRLSATAASISAKSLGSRLDASGADSEFAELIEVFNAMLERLERSFTQATRFSADAAHELKTPLTILQGQLELALQKAEDQSEQQRALAQLLDETHRLKSVSRKLLLLAQADAGKLVASPEKVDLRPLVEECVEAVSGAEASGSLFRVNGGEAPLFAFCDGALTRQILVNLFGNALKYNAPGDAEITVDLVAAECGAIRVAVENSCRPIDEEERKQLFERFARLDSSRNRATEGTGLGLSLALEFARVQGGELAVVEGLLTNRIRFSLTLPAFEDKRDEI